MPDLIVLACCSCSLLVASRARAGEQPGWCGGGDFSPNLPVTEEQGITDWSLAVRTVYVAMIMVCGACLHLSLVQVSYSQK